MENSKINVIIEYIINTEYCLSTKLAISVSLSKEEKGLMEIVRLLETIILFKSSNKEIIVMNLQNSLKKEYTKTQE